MKANLPTALLIALTLAGCSQEKANSLVVCQKEADRFYRAYQAADVSNPRSRYIIGCMVSKGYEFDVTPADCNSEHALPTQSACYTPDNWVTWLVEKFPSL